MARRTQEQSMIITAMIVGVFLVVSALLMSFAQDKPEGLAPEKVMVTGAALITLAAGGKAGAYRS